MYLLKLWRIFYEVICIFMLEHLTRIFNLSTISSFETRTLNYSTRAYWHQIGCEIASYGWECRICRGEHGRTGCIKISSLRPRTASNAVSNLRSGYGVSSDTHVSMGWRFHVLSIYGLFRSPRSASRYYNGLYLVTLLRICSALNANPISLCAPHSHLLAQNSITLPFFSYCVN